jgi:hypothetical protein
MKARVPAEFPAGPVLLPDEDDAGVAWAQVVSRECLGELRDPAGTSPRLKTDKQRSKGETQVS